MRRNLTGGIMAKGGPRDAPLSDVARSWPRCLGAIALIAARWRGGWAVGAGDFRAAAVCGLGGTARAGAPRGRRPVRRGAAAQAGSDAPRRPAFFTAWTSP